MELPKINQKVELQILSGPLASAYSTYVDDVQDQYISLVRPTVGGETVPLASGDQVRVEFAQAGSARISFQTRVVDVAVHVVPVVMVALPEPEKVQRFQQRDFVRLDVRLPLTYYIIYAPEGGVRPTGSFSSHTRDISGNGAQILCPDAYPAGTQLDLHIELPGRRLHVVGEVIRAVEFVRPKEHWLGVRFIGLDERDRDLIIRFIFNEQRERRRKGLL